MELIMLGFKKTPYLENVAKLIIFDYLLKFVKYSHLSNKRGVHAYRLWKIPPSTKKESPSTFIDFITKVTDFIAEPNDNFSYSHFEF